MRCYKCMGELNEDNYCNNCGEVTVPNTKSHLLVPGTILNNKFLIGNSIGEGGFGITYIGFDTTLNIRVAIKEYFPSDYANRDNKNSNNITPNSQNHEDFFYKGKSKFLDEARSLAKFSNEQGIVQVRDFFEENNTAYIVMEYLDGITLKEYITKNGVMNAETVFSLMIPIMQSLKKIHENQIIHRDISPDNIMFLNSGQLKLMDFGSARQYSEENNTKTILIKNGYAPIEQHKSDGNQGPWTDVYGLCATMYKCITGVTPEDSIERYMGDNIKTPSELGVNISAPLESVLMYGLAVYHDNRCQNMTELLEITNNALENRTVLLTNENNTSVQDDIYRTQMADDTYKKQVANNMYNGATYNPNYSNQMNNGYMDNMPSSAYGNPQMYPPKKKSKKLPIIVAIIITVCVMVAVGAVMYVVFNDNNNFGQNTTVGVTHTEITSESTEQNSTTTDTTVNDTTTTKPSTSQTETTATSSSVLEKATYFASAEASSSLPNEYQYNYSPSNVLNNDDTCWCENSSGLGTGEWIKLELPKTQLVSGLKIINGYAGTEKQYNTNSKVTDIFIEFSNGYSVEKTLDVYDAKDRNKVQTIMFDEPIETSYVKITIEGADEGDCEDTCLTYVAPY